MRCDNSDLSGVARLAGPDRTEAIDPTRPASDLTRALLRTPAIRRLLRGPLVPGVVALILAGAAATASVASAPGTIGLLGAALALLMSTIAAIDGRRFVIPDALTVAGFALALVHAAAQAPDAIMAAMAMAAVRGAALALIFYCIRGLYARIRGRDGLGLGDVKLAAVAGAWLDWSTMPIAIELAALAALAVYLLRQFALGRPIRATSRLPFGLFFAPAIWACWLLETVLLAPF
jgi:leader peptidase (prepilin peptidase)/N-methyltransferase